jgi:DNA-binding NtrC family response regulator/serine/threonine protein kinase/tetratricopeptide (TPR) repeat protein
VNIASTKYFPSEITEEYEIVSSMGRTDRWETYRIIRRADERDFVLRVDRHAPESARDRRATGDEYIALRRVRHPAFPELIQIGLLRSGGYYLIRDFIRGVNLRNVIRHLDFPFLVDVLAKLLPPLHLLHLQGFTHGRISPEKIIVSGLDEDRTVHLVDLGLPASPDHRRWAPPAYRAPEWLDSGRVDGRADLYSLAVLSYELMAANHPFPLRASGRLEENRLGWDLPPLSTIREDCPRALNEILLRMGSGERRARPENALAVAQELPRTGLLGNRKPTLDLKYVVECTRWKTTELRVKEVLSHFPTGPLPSKIIADPELEDVADEIRARAQLRRPRRMIRIRLDRGQHGESKAIRSVADSHPSILSLAGVDKARDHRQTTQTNESHERSAKIIRCRVQSEKDLRLWIVQFCIGPLDIRRSHLLASVMQTRQQKKQIPWVDWLSNRILLCKSRPRIDWEKCKVIDLVKEYATQQSHLQSRESASTLRKHCFPREAARLLCNSLETANELTTVSRASSMYRIGENYRAAGDMNLAHQWFARSSDTINAAEPPLALALAFRKELTRELDPAQRKEDAPDCTFKRAKTNLSDREPLEALVTIRRMQVNGEHEASRQLLAGVIKESRCLGRRSSSSLWSRASNAQQCAMSRLKIEIGKARVRQKLREAKPEAALRLLQRNLREDGESNSTPNRGQLLSLLATVYLLRGDEREAKRQATIACKHARDRGNVRRVISSISNMMVSEAGLGRHESALGWAVVATNEENGTRGITNRAVMMMNCSAIASDAGEQALGRKYALQGMRLARAAGMKRIEASCRHNLANALYGAGSYGGARRQFEKALASKSVPEEHALRKSALSGLAKVCLLTGKHEEAEVHLRELKHLWWRQGEDGQQYLTDFAYATGGYGNRRTKRICRRTEGFGASGQEMRPDHGDCKSEASGTGTSDSLASVVKKNITILWRIDVDIGEMIDDAISSGLKQMADGEAALGAMLCAVAGLRAAAEGSFDRCSRVIRLLQSRSHPLLAELRNYCGGGPMSVVADCLNRLRRAIRRFDVRRGRIEGIKGLKSKVLDRGTNLADLRDYLNESAIGAIGNLIGVFDDSLSVLVIRRSEGGSAQLLWLGPGFECRASTVRVSELHPFSAPPSGFSSWEGPDGVTWVHLCPRYSCNEVVVWGSQTTNRSGALDCVSHALPRTLMRAHWGERRKPNVRRRVADTKEMRSHADDGLSRLLSAQGIVSVSSSFLEVCSTVRKLALRGFPILLTGESGVGKELLARFAHSVSPNRVGALVPIDCPTLSSGVVESELFGHVTGAFTGATQDRSGLLAEADGGTLFLDEIGDTDHRTQAKLLRALDHGEVRPIGATALKRVDFLLVSATNADLVSAMDSGQFRRDLYHRLGVAVRVPPLRARREDVILLWEWFLARFDTSPKEYESSVADFLLEYQWPGNVRELLNVCRACAALAGSGPIGMMQVSGVMGKGAGSQQSGMPVQLRSHTEKSAQRQAIINRILDMKGRVSRREYAAEAGISARTALRDLQEFLNLGLLLRLGEGRGTRYVRSDDRLVSAGQERR